MLVEIFSSSSIFLSVVALRELLLMMPMLVRELPQAIGSTWWSARAASSTGSRPGGAENTRRASIAQDAISERRASIADDVLSVS